MTFEAAFEKLARSKFRSRFRLSDADRAYIEKHGLDVIRRHAEDFVRQRLAPANPPNDGRQTPMRGHPVFTAQHATATCCRGCLNKWWKVPLGVELSPLRQQKAVNLIMAWIVRNAEAQTMRAGTKRKRPKCDIISSVCGETCV